MKKVKKIQEDERIKGTNRIQWAESVKESKERKELKEYSRKNQKIQKFQNSENNQMMSQQYEEIKII